MRSASNPPARGDREATPPASAPLRVRWRLNDPAQEDYRVTRVHLARTQLQEGRERTHCGLYVPEFAYDTHWGDDCPPGVPECKRCRQQAEKGE